MSEPRVHTTYCLSCESECTITPINSEAEYSDVAFCPYCGDELDILDDEDEEWDDGDDDQWDDEC